MADAKIARKPFQRILFKYFAHKTHSPVDVHISHGPAGIGDCDTAGFLSPVLQGGEPIVNGACHILPVRVVDSEDAAGFFDPAFAFLTVLMHGRAPLQRK